MGRSLRGRGGGWGGTRWCEARRKVQRRRGRNGQIVPRKGGAEKVEERTGRAVLERTLREQGREKGSLERRGVRQSGEVGRSRAGWNGLGAAELDVLGGEEGWGEYEAGRREEGQYEEA